MKKLLICKAQFHTTNATQAFTTGGQFFVSYETPIALLCGNAQTLFINQENYTKTTQCQLSRWLYEAGFRTLGTSASREARKKSGKPFQVENAKGGLFNVCFVPPEALAQSWEEVAK